MLHSLIGILVTGSIALGCQAGGHQAKTTLVRNVEHVDSAALLVESKNGSIEVIADPSIHEVTISARITCGGDTQAEADQRVASTVINADRDVDGLLTIKPAFPAPDRSNDGASLVVRLPNGKGADIRTSNGSVTVRSFAGSLVVSTSNGTVSVSDHDGPATIDTSNGSVDAVNIGGPLHVDTSNGSITAKLRSDQPGPIVLDSSNGWVRATVGPAFQGAMTLDTSNGKLRIEDASKRASIADLDGNEGRIVVGQGGEPSRIDTSNGSIDLTIES